MLKHRHTLISVLILTVLSFFACNKDSDIGLGLLPEDSQLKHLTTDTISLETITKKMDTIAGSRVSKLLIGKYTDPVFGVSEAATAVQITLGDYRNFSDTLMADSVYLNLSYNNTDLRAYGDSTVLQTVNVYRMRKNLKYDSIYYTNTEPESLHNGELMGSTSFKTDGNPDSILRIKLDNSWADFFMHAEDSAVYEFGEDFRNYFNGFVLTTDDNPNASIVSLTLNTESRMKVYYHHPSDPDSAREANFPINEFCARLNMFSHDYTGTPAETAMGNDEEQTFAYLQGMNGLITHIKTPFLENMREAGNIAIFKAELIAETAEENVSLHNSYPRVPRLTATGANEDGSFFALPEYSAEAGYQSIGISETGQYRFNITSYTQKIISGTWENNGLYIYPASSSQSFYRSVINGAKNDKPIKLIITYSEL